MQKELWITAIFNNYLPGAGNWALGLVGMPAQARPWANFIVMELFVVALIALTFAIMRAGLSVDRPGKLQHIGELLYNFVHEQAEDQVGHEGARYVSFFGTIFVFILISNLIGLFPCFESPTMNAPVTAGCAIATFLYYNVVGIWVNRFRYVLHFLGPVWWLAPLMVLIEIASHLARPMSLTIRLFANMFAGEQVTLVFLRLTYFLIPVIFMGLHVFVGVVQAYIFMLLTMSYVGASVAHEH